MKRRLDYVQIGATVFQWACVLAVLFLFITSPNDRAPIGLMLFVCGASVGATTGIGIRDGGWYR